MDIGNYEYIEIKNESSFEDVSIKLARALGISFEQEISGRFEEFPAYVAQDIEYIYYLIGIPEPEHDLREVKDNTYYDLQIIPRGKQRPPADRIVKKINDCGELKCCE